VSDHIITVAFHVTGDDLSRLEAQEALLNVLPRPSVIPSAAGTVAMLDSWWEAEDDRIDGSDNDSAVFVTAGAQRKAFALLKEAGLTGSWNDPDTCAGPARGQFEIEEG
jgi:hypothetical protein